MDIGIFTASDDIDDLAPQAQATADDVASSIRAAGKAGATMFNGPSDERAATRELNRE